MRPRYTSTGAFVDSTGTYRYNLTRRWASGDLLGFVMLNPSTADANKDDATIRRCVGFAAMQHFAGIMVCNLYAYRTNDPLYLKLQGSRGVDTVGPSNDRELADMHEQCGSIVCAWGSHAPAERAQTATVLLHRQGTELLCLGRTARGFPKHPLYVPYSATFEIYP